jgi:hypothetical protein
MRQFFWGARRRPARPTRNGPNVGSLADKSPFGTETAITLWLDKPSGLGSFALAFLMPRMRSVRRSYRADKLGARSRDYCAAKTNGTFTVVVPPVAGNCHTRTRAAMQLASPG